MSSWFLKYSGVSCDFYWVFFIGVISDCVWNDWVKFTIQIGKVHLWLQSSLNPFLAYLGAICLRAYISWAGSKLYFKRWMVCANKFFSTAGCFISRYNTIYTSLGPFSSATASNSNSTFCKCTVGGGGEKIDTCFHKFPRYKA